MLQRYRTDAYRDEAEKNYCRLSEKEMLQEYQQLKKEQAEALVILKNDTEGKDLFKRYQELYPSIRGQLGMEEAFALDVVTAVSKANTQFFENKCQ